MKSYHIITDRKLNKIVLFKENESYFLPSYQVRKISNISKKLKSITGLNTHLLYSVIDDSNKKISVYLSVVDSGVLKDDLSFFDINKLPDFEIKDIVINWSIYKNKKFNLPWFNNDWFINTKNILKDRYNYDDINIFYLSPISCILKIKTKTENIFYKRILKGLFEQEVLLTKLLNDTFPDNTPKVIDYDSKEGFLLLEDFGSKTLWNFSDIETWCKTIKQYAQMQKSILKNIDSLKSIPIFDRNTSKLFNILENIVSQKELLYLDKDYGITTLEYQSLLELMPKIKKLCDELDSFNIPNTIEHGDMHPFNIAFLNNKPIFYDWSDCSISHPFFSLRSFTYSFFDKQGKELKNVPFIKNCDYPYQKIVSSYLEEWEEFDTKGNLLKAFEISKILVNIFFIDQYVLLTNAMEEHTQHVYKGHIAKGIRKLIKLILSVK